MTRTAKGIPALANEKLIYTTNESCHALGISRATFSKYVKRLGLEPRMKYFQPRYRWWTYQQLQRILECVYKTKKQRLELAFELADQRQRREHGKD